MSMEIKLGLLLPLKFYQLEEAAEVERVAVHTDSRVYCWQTTGKWNWLQKGWHLADVVGLVVLPGGLPDVTDMPDDGI